MLKNLFVSALSLLLSLCLAELILQRHSLGPAYLRSWQTWAPYDTRDRLQFILDEREEGRDAFPAPNAKFFIGNPVLVRGERVVPLGGVANSIAVGGSEGGFHSAFAVDEAGFNNPRGIWPLKAVSNVFLVGDSFTYGDAVRQGDDVASRLREHVPYVVNLGARGNGPLQQLAAIREYVPSGKVGFVFWMFYERNDLIDLNDGKADPILMGYLEENFSQDLLARQDDINAAVRSYIEERVQKERGGRPMIFPALRKRLKDLAPRRVAEDKGAEEGEGKKSGEANVDIALFTQVVARAKREVESKGGRFVFVYLPSYRRFSGEPLSPWASHKEAVIESVEAIDASMIDIESHFLKTGDPLSLFPFRLNGHYNELGYALVGRILADFIKRRASGPAPPEKPK